MKRDYDKYALLKLLVLKRDGFKCKKCGRRDTLHVHHVEFRSQGGADSMDNLVTLCFQCHEKVHTREVRYEV